jgi:hypothetical protein
MEKKEGKKGRKDGNEGTVGMKEERKEGWA